MSDLRVDTHAIERRYGLGGEELWNVTPVWDKASSGKRRDTSGEADPMIRGVIRIFEATTSAQHRDAVEVLAHDLLWDGPPIRLSNKGHVRLAAYLFKYFAHVRITPITALLSEPTPGHQLIELDAVAVSKPHRPLWLLPTQLLPAEVAKNVHLKIGVKGGLQSGKVELLTGRLTNLPPFLFEWARTLNGVLMGAVPHALETPLGFAFDFADGGHYYAQKRHAAFKARHPGSTNPNWDWALDCMRDVPAWAQAQATIGAESLQAVFGHSLARLSHTANALVNFYVWLFTTVWQTMQQLADVATGTVNQAAGGLSSSMPGTAAAGTAAGGGGGRPERATLSTAPPSVPVTRRPAAAAAGGGAASGP